MHHDLHVDDVDPDILRLDCSICTVYRIEQPYAYMHVRSLAGAEFPSFLPWLVHMAASSLAGPIDWNLTNLVHLR